ncbi:hypothetical protein HY503_00050 [Candidatus Woesebacteria bacterium]|nr:hypothetical protein [Candidatus Woesebacteria bacterium]
MFQKVVAILSALFLASTILFISVLRAASVNYAFSLPSEKTLGQSDSEEININYTLPYPGRILPDHPLWPLKALRDKLWLLVTVNPSRKAELVLLFADKRLSSSKILFERGKPELAFSTLSKGEKYLEEAVGLEVKNRKEGFDTKEFLAKAANAALKHREVIGEILKIAPEDARPNIIKVENYARDAYKNLRDALNSLGLPAPENPFNGD